MKTQVNLKIDMDVKTKAQKRASDLGLWATIGRCATPERERVDWVSIVLAVLNLTLRPSALRGRTLPEKHLASENGSSDLGVFYGSM